MAPKRQQCNLFKIPKCANDRTYGCIISYVESMIKMSKFGLLKSIDNERDDDFQPTMVIIGPDVETDQEVISERIENLGEKLGAKEARKKYAVVYFEDAIYIIGGYIFQNGAKERIPPSCEYKYWLESKKFEPIAKLPKARINFGMATDGRYIVVVGGQSYQNESLKSCWSLNTADKTWIQMSPLPAPIVGPGLCFSGKYLHLVGGLDIVYGVSEVVNDNLLYDIHNDAWLHLPHIFPKRARPMIVYPTEEGVKTGLYCIGGVGLDDETYKSILIEKIQYYDYLGAKWELVTDTPPLDRSDIFSYSNGIIYISEKIIDKTGHLIDTKVKYSYNLRDNIWKEGSAAAAVADSEKKSKGQTSPTKSSPSPRDVNYEDNRSPKDRSPRERDSPRIAEKTLRGKESEIDDSYDSNMEAAFPTDYELPSADSPLESSSADGDQSEDENGVSETSNESGSARKIRDRTKRHGKKRKHRNRHKSSGKHKERSRKKHSVDSKKGHRKSKRKSSKTRKRSTNFNQDPRSHAQSAESYSTNAHRIKKSLIAKRQKYREMKRSGQKYIPQKSTILHWDFCDSDSRSSIQMKKKRSQKRKSKYADENISREKNQKSKKSGEKYELRRLHLGNRNIKQRRRGENQDGKRRNRIKSESSRSSSEYFYSEYSSKFKDRLKSSRAKKEHGLRRKSKNRSYSKNSSVVTKKQSHHRQNEGDRIGKRRENRNSKKHKKIVRSSTRDSGNLTKRYESESYTNLACRCCEISDKNENIKKWRTRESGRNGRVKSVSRKLVANSSNLSSESLESEEIKHRTKCRKEKEKNSSVIHRRRNQSTPKKIERHAKREEGGGRNNDTSERRHSRKIETNTKVPFMDEEKPMKFGNGSIRIPGVFSDLYGVKINKSYHGNLEKVKSH